jgi:hypothetical protein
MNPRSHLRLVYEANPLSYLVEQGGSKGTDGKRRILEMQEIAFFYVLMCRPMINFRFCSMLVCGED